MTSQLTPLELHGARREEGTSIAVRIAEGRVEEISADGLRGRRSACAIDLHGHLLLPGLINAHDHLGFALFPRMGGPTYSNYIEWGEDIHRRFPDVIAKHKAVPKDARAWWGGIRNLLCGVTTVSHHDPLWPVLREAKFPVKVAQTNGWAHSPALGGDLREARRATPAGGVFVLHACEGVDRVAREELWRLDDMGLLHSETVLVHGLAIDSAGIALMRRRGAALIVCPSSNRFLFGQIPDLPLFAELERIALGSDSPLTAEGDLLDEVRFAIGRCGVAPHAAYRMVTTSPAEILRLEKGAGDITLHGPGDLIAVRDKGQNAVEMLPGLTFRQIELVIVNGKVQLASPAMMERLAPALRQDMEPLEVAGAIRWLRAPVNQLLHEAERALGAGQVRLGSKPIRAPA